MFVLLPNAANDDLPLLYRETFPRVVKAPGASMMSRVKPKLLMAAVLSSSALPGSVTFH